MDQTLSEKVFKPLHHSKSYPKHFLRRYDWILRDSRSSINHTCISDKSCAVHHIAQMAALVWKQRNFRRTAVSHQN